MEITANSEDGSLILIKQGAEARVFESTFVGRRCVVKERFSKKYRHPSLDSKITLKRLNAEARCMTKARRLGVSTPVLYAVDPVQHTLTFEYVEGPSVKDIFLEFGLHGIMEEQLEDIALQIGNAIAKLHDGGLIHGDLTTSNMLIRSGKNQLVLIDFGLSFTSTLPEDKAVDLYVLERALLSLHSSCGNVMDRILSAYRKSSKQWSSTLNKLAQESLPTLPTLCRLQLHSRRAEPLHLPLPCAVKAKLLQVPLPVTALRALSPCLHLFRVLFCNKLFNQWIQEVELPVFFIVPDTVDFIKSVLLLIYVSAVQPEILTRTELIRVYNSNLDPSQKLCCSINECNCRLLSPVSAGVFALLESSCVYALLVLDLV
ncbi:non-specific serine/threonine protein kinase [Citrus sinensis]|uniref:Non-specific serine/threonine protein kinase n=1 Tax=Citrus sinensis TaxID=2711 RepID=A0ACB8MJP1_CITSI|nr:non-specific serine/threonine protein kinase [Citrus sinensis]